MPRRLSKERTRKKMIDPQLENAGWYLRGSSRAKIELSVDDYEAGPWNGVSDYCMYRENGKVLVVVSSTIQMTQMSLINMLPKKVTDIAFEDV